VSSGSVPDGPPGVPLEQARVVRPEHEEGHARYRQLLERLDRVIALLEQLAQALGTLPAPRRRPAGPGPAAR
jgi:hypothetical protein